MRCKRVVLDKKLSKITPCKEEERLVEKVECKKTIIGEIER